MPSQEQARVWQRWARGVYLEEDVMEVHGAARAAAAVERVRVPPHVNARVKVQVPTLLRCQAHLQQRQCHRLSACPHKSFGRFQS